MIHQSDAADCLVDSLNQKDLLGLAAQATSPDKPAQAFAIPSEEELNSLFPELQIREQVGSGGMGCVFRARQVRLERDIALKILPRELGRDDLFAERFGREARAMARLNHPNIVSIHDFGQREGLHYLAMEYMDGMNLRELLDAGPLPSIEALKIFEQVCQALAYAHAEGVVHRDIKPENILFSKRGHVALADFGLARLASDSHAAVSLTQTRQAMGTLNYMAPEQCETPKHVDHRADIYSLGILLYEMLTGRVPRGSFPQASSLCEVTEIVDEAIHKALQVDVHARHQSVTDFCEAVFADSAGIPVPLAFDQHGTVTNFMNLGANVLRSFPRPQRILDTHWAGRNAVWTSLVATILVLLLTVCPWLDTADSFEFGYDTYVLVADRVQIPIAMVPVMTSIVFVLSLFRRRIHPLRADLLTLVICGLCIAQIGLSIADLRAFGHAVGIADAQRTICPFLVLLVLSFLFVETLIRLIYHISSPLIAWHRRSLSQQQQKQADRKAWWLARYRQFSAGVIELVNRIRNPDKPAK